MFRYTSEIVHAFRIPRRNSSSPLIKFTTTARRNELIARARRRGQLNASNVASSWMISIYERPERCTFIKARWLAAMHDGAYLGGLHIFASRIIRPCTVTRFPDSLLSILKFVFPHPLSLIPLPCPRHLHLAEVTLRDSLQIHFNFRIRGQVSLAIVDYILRTLILDSLVPHCIDERRYRLLPSCSGHREDLVAEFDSGPIRW